MMLLSFMCCSGIMLKSEVERKLGRNKENNCWILVRANSLREWNSKLIPRAKRQEFGASLSRPMKEGSPHDPEEHFGGTSVAPHE